MENLLDCTIKDIIKKHPETLEIFINNGFGVFAGEEALNELGAVLKLKTALRTKKIGAEAFVGLLNEKIEEAANYTSLLSSIVVNKPGNFNFIAQIPCGLKVPLERELQPVLQHMQEGSSAFLLNYYTGSCCNDFLNINECIPHYRDIDEVPDLVLTKSYHFFNERFVDRFIKTGFYAMTPQQAVNDQIAGIDIIDRDGNYNVVSLTTTVMVVDRKRLGNLPVPKTWADLLQPEYEGKVVMNSYGDNFSDVVLLNIYKDYGVSGIEALGRAIHSGTHAAQMIKSMASNKPDLPPIYVMGDFFAHTISADTDIEIVWPEEGALVMPFYFMVKASKAEELKELIAFLSSRQVGQLCADAYFPSVHPAVNNKMPAGAKLKWLGWDYIKEHDIEDLIERLNNRCQASHRCKVGRSPLSLVEKGGIAVGGC